MGTKPRDRASKRPPAPAAAVYDPEAVEAKWQARWAAEHVNEPDLDRAARPFYNLMMYPYPSAEGLHVGNMFAFTGSDVYGRFKRLQGFDVFEPIGFDAFGIHSENYAIKVGTHPAQLIPQNIATFRRQLRRMGGMFDWRHEVSTTDPAYYKWTQWIFLQLYKAGKAYKKLGAVNWCPECKTVLANEQVIDGYCERHPDVRVEQRTLEQWYFRITEYVEQLLGHLDDPAKMDWSESTAAAQRNWIGRSEGAEIRFRLVGRDDVLAVFTTRPDTIFGATFMVLAPEHPLVASVTSDDQRQAVQSYIRAASAKDIVSRRVGERDKTGVFTGGYAVNPATGADIPIWIADYVLMEYGTGAIMAVPAHDERDLEFAETYDLSVVRVIDENDRLLASGQFTGRPASVALRDIIQWLEQSGTGHGQVQYRLYDWCISRQRYWGPPIPVIYCDACGTVPVPEEDLPVLLPPLEDFRPDDSGTSPLARNEEWFFVPCPSCGQRARRETDVSDTFLDSGWYYLRYPSTEFDDRPFDRTRTQKWCPVTTYIGGNEHAVLHLLYARFLAMVLHELGHLDFDEPFLKFRAHGLIVKDGAKMSKSRGNVVIPDEYIARWGADTFRMYLMSLGPFQEGGDFRDAGISGPRRFLDKVWGLVERCVTEDAVGEVKHTVMVKWHQTKQKITGDIEELKYNTAIAALMELLNTMREVQCHERRIIEDMLVMLAPFAPHFAEECWERLGHDRSIFFASWPTWDAALLVEDNIEVVVQVNGRTRSTVRVRREADEGVVLAAAMADDKTARHLEGKTIRKRIYVPNRLINLVVG
ncbi:MAG TPA: leucine--tRNA ligase [Gemmatimonadales bacterium]|nr:leucine--tRNA ligase [Gemmatimonadales bacterium]